MAIHLLARVGLPLATGSFKGPRWIREPHFRVTYFEGGYCTGSDKYSQVAVETRDPTGRLASFVDHERRAANMPGSVAYHPVRDLHSLVRKIRLLANNER